MPNPVPKMMVVGSLRALAVAMLLAGCVTTGTGSGPRYGSTGTDPLAVGAKVTGNFSLGAIHVPVPPGDWLVGSLVEQSAPVSQGPTNYLHAALVEEANGKLRRAIIVNTVASQQSSGYGWNRNLDVCDAKDVIFNGSPSYFHSESGQCWMLDYTTIASASAGVNTQDAFLRDLYRFKVERRIDSRVPMVYARFYVTNRSNYARISYFFNPEAAGIPTSYVQKANSEWHPSRYLNSPERRDFVEMLKRFAGEMTPQIVAGLDRRIPLESPTEIRSLSWPVAARTPLAAPRPPEGRQEPARSSSPQPAPVPAPLPPGGETPQTPEQRLLRLDDLRARGVISRDEYDRRRKAIVDLL